MAITLAKYGKKNVEVVFGNGKKVVYSFNVGNAAKLAKWIDTATRIEEIAKGLSDSGEVKEAVALEREIIKMVLGTRCWLQIKRLTGTDIFAMMEIIVELSRVMKTGIEESLKNATKANG